jgi:hypothetical protein
VNDEAKEQDNRRAGRDLRARCGADRVGVGRRSALVRRATKLAENTPTAITGTGTGTSSLTSVIGTINIDITCTTIMSNAGTILNPSGGGMGTASGIGLVFTGCTVDSEGQGCKVKGVTVTDPEGRITTAAVLKATAETGMKVSFSPEGASSTKFVELELFGCTTGALNRKYAVTGSATGVEEATASGMPSFDSTSGSALKLGGIAATFTNTTDITVGGAAVTIGEP